MRNKIFRGEKFRPILLISDQETLNMKHMTLNEAVERLLTFAMKSGAASSKGASRCAGVLLHAYNSADWELRLDEVALLDRDLKAAALTVIEARINGGGMPNLISSFRTARSVLGNLLLLGSEAILTTLRFRGRIRVEDFMAEIHNRNTISPIDMLPSRRGASMETENSIGPH